MRLKPKVYDILMDVKRGLLNNEIIRVVTGDFGMNRFNLKLLEDRLAPYNLQNAIVRIMVVTPSGSKQQQDMIVENAIGGSANITLKQSLFSESGGYLAEFQIFDETTQVLRLTTPRFEYYAVESLQDEETIMASDEYSILQQMLEDVGDINNNINGKVEIHNTDEESHNDIRQEIADLTTQSNENTEHITSFITNNPDAKNSIYRGKYLGSSVTPAQYSAISSGAFTDLYIGDYWTIGGINWRIAAFNYYRNTGDTSLSVNHITIVPDTQLYSHAMNDTDTTIGGYVGSKMYTEGLEQAKTTIRGVFGSHLVKHRQYLSNAVIDGKTSGGAWLDSEVDLMNEIMVYGGVVNGDGVYGLYNVGVGKNQLPLFALNPKMVNTRQSIWLRDVVSGAYFAFVRYSGNAASSAASNALGVRPAFSIS